MSTRAQTACRRRWRSAAALVFAHPLTPWVCSSLAPFATRAGSKTRPLFCSSIRYTLTRSDTACTHTHPLTHTQADLFREKLKKVPLKKYFEEYTGGGDFKQGCEFMEEQFLAMNKNPKKTIYTHITTATDTGTAAAARSFVVVVLTLCTDTMEKVFGAVKDIVIKDSLRKAGLLDE